MNEVDGGTFYVTKLNPIQYSDLIKIARTHDCGCVYPLSVAEGIQEGDIFTKSVDDLKTILFWTQSGFAYLSGDIDESFLEDIYEIMMERNRTHKKRFILMSKNQYIDNYFMTKQDVCIGKGDRTLKLTRYEQETIINFNAGDQTATLYTRDPVVMRQLDALVTEYPDIFKCVGETDIDKTYSMPKSRISYRKPRRISAAKRQQARDAMKKINECG